MEKQTIKYPFRVAIEGNVGAGKSTLMKYFEYFNEVDLNLVSVHLFLFLQKKFLKNNT